LLDEQVGPDRVVVMGGGRCKETRAVEGASRLGLKADVVLEGDPRAGVLLILLELRHEVRTPSACLVVVAFFWSEGSDEPPLDELLNQA